MLRVTCAHRHDRSHHRRHESLLVQPSVIVTGGNRQAKRRAIEANHDLSFWRQALETERLRLRLLQGLLLS
jgi:hypothetical protein